MSLIVFLGTNLLQRSKKMAVKSCQSFSMSPINFSSHVILCSSLRISSNLAFLKFHTVWRGTCIGKVASTSVFTMTMTITMMVSLEEKI